MLLYTCAVRKTEHYVPTDVMQIWVWDPKGELYGEQCGVEVRVLLKGMGEWLGGRRWVREGDP